MFLNNLAISWHLLGDFGNWLAIRELIRDKGFRSGGGL